MESTIFTPWSKKVIPFLSLRWKMKAFQDDKRQNTMIPWNDSNTAQFLPLSRHQEIQESVPLAKLEPGSQAEIISSIQ